MEGQIVRTTLYFPKDVHSRLKEEAFRKAKSFNKLVLEKLAPKKLKKADFKIKAFNLGASGKLRRAEIYEDVLNHRG